MILEETSLSGVKTAMGEHLQPDLFAFDFWQWRRVLLWDFRPTIKRLLE